MPAGISLSNASTITTASHATPIPSSSLLGVRVMGEAEASSVPPLNSGEETSFITSPSFPPVPAKVVGRILKGHFVDIKDLMPDNAALRNQLLELGSNSSTTRFREVEDPLSWVFYFLSYIAIASRSKNVDIAELAGYAQIIIHIAQRHGGKGWQAYDRLFRQQIAAGFPLQWNQISPSLLASTVLVGSKTVCQLCNGVDHPQSACALQAGVMNVISATENPSKKAKMFPEACRRFNKGECKLSQDSCKFSHGCLACGAAHPITSCLRFKIAKQ